MFVLSFHTAPVLSGTWSITCWCFWAPTTLGFGCAAKNSARFCYSPLHLRPNCPMPPILNSSKLVFLDYKFVSGPQLSSMMALGQLPMQSQCTQQWMATARKINALSTISHRHTKKLWTEKTGMLMWDAGNLMAGNMIEIINTKPSNQCVHDSDNNLDIHTPWLHCPYHIDKI